mmetsp:Transcript_9272/g.27903  ORF Transcript_9272/g.27903 Transcript_9272/m.27903 type:complete len:83 (+) Transcript_9272:20-268(+)
MVLLRKEVDSFERYKGSNVYHLDSGSSCTLGSSMICDFLLQFINGKTLLLLYSLIPPRNGRFHLGRVQSSLLASLKPALHCH